MAQRVAALMWRQLLQRSARESASLQAQIREMLVGAILDGQLPAGEPVPSSREMAEQLGVARNTVVLAYQQLADEGYLLSRQRSGHFVNAAMIAKRPPGQRLMIWCAACSSGQEPYSIAMLVHEHFPALAGSRLRIIATDLSDAILARAREGLYSQIEVNRGLPAALLVKYFTKQGLQWRIKSEIRRMVEFQQGNLAATWPFLPQMDLIFIRNVLIYFGVDTKKAILAKVRGILKPDGYLFLGSSETTLTLDAAFEPVSIGKTLCYQLHPEKIPPR